MRQNGVLMTTPHHVSGSRGRVIPWIAQVDSSDVKLSAWRSDAAPKIDTLTIQKVMADERNQKL